MPKFAQKCRNNAILKQKYTLKLFFVFKMAIFVVSVKGKSRFPPKSITDHWKDHS